jgi:hypothetical protein
MADLTKAVELFIHAVAPAAQQLDNPVVPPPDRPCERSGPWLFVGKIRGRTPR